MNDMTQSINLAHLELNTGQLEGLPANPRFIRDDKFEKLKKSLYDDPEMLGYRELLVYPLDNGNYIIIGGNMRYRAAKELGYQELPCKVIPKEVPIDKLKAYTIKDNNGYGDWDWNMLENEWDMELLTDCGLELHSFAGNSIDFDNVEDISKDNYEPTSQVYLECPKCHHQDMQIHFKKIEVGTATEFAEDEFEEETEEDIEDAF